MLLNDCRMLLRSSDAVLLLVWVSCIWTALVAGTWHGQMALLAYGDGS